MDYRASLMDVYAINSITRGLWGPVVAVTAASDGGSGAQIAITAQSASILPEYPRILIQLWKNNRTHDLVQEGAFAVHLLPEGRLDLVTTLGHQSGHWLDKLAGQKWRRGETGSPILLEALAFLECRLRAQMDGGDMTVFLGEVVAGGTLREGLPMTMDWLRANAGAGWHAAESERLARARAEARARLGLPEPA